MVVHEVSTGLEVPSEVDVDAVCAVQQTVQLHLVVPEEKGKFRLKQLTGNQIRYSRMSSIFSSGTLTLLS